MFTDVEGSTRLLAELGDAYGEALSDHRRVVREAVVRHGGVEVDTQGDAFFVAFADADAAVAAALEAQADLDLPVRMGVHTGQAERTDEGYVGLEVHRAARICAVAHGGQVVVSDAARVGLADGAAALTDLGLHRLKDLAEPVRLFQLGEREFPPLRSLNATNLPVQPNALVGRERELAEITALVRDGARLLTLTGPGGTGKTRLAQEAAAELVEDFPDGVFLVSLAAVGDPDLVVPTIEQTLGAKVPLAEHVDEKRLLLLLDNFEQVAGAAPQLADALARCPYLTLLTTSRVLLQLHAEHEYRVPPLPGDDAVELFHERAFDAEPEQAVREICRRLDGLPLAIELAAARTRVLAPETLLSRLDERLPLLTGGPRDAPERQRTLRATIQWSHDLLSAEEQQLFRRLAVFVGGWTVDAAERICDADLDTLGSLVDKSLVRSDTERFTMLETIREYGLERLRAVDDETTTRARLAEWVRALAIEARPRLVTGEQAEWLERLDAERDNVRAVLEWALEADDADLALTVAAALGRFWWVRGAAEGLAWLERGLVRPGVAPDVRTAALEAAGGTAYFAGDLDRALSLFEEGLRVSRETGDKAAVAMMLTRLAPPLAELGRVEEAERLAEEAVAMNRELGATEELSLSLGVLGGIVTERDIAKATELLEESGALAREVGDLWQVAWTLHNLAYLALRADDPERARSLCREGLDVARTIGDHLAVVICFSLLAVAIKRLGDARRAGEFWGATLRLDGELGESLWRTTRPHSEEMLGHGDAEFDQGVEEGARLSLDEAVALADAPLD